MAKAKPITGLYAQAATGTNARIIARERLEEMYGWEPYVEHPYEVHQLHNLRIATKRLRYTLEIFEDVFPERCHAVLKELEQIQEELGSLHDTDVSITLLRLCLGSLDGGTGYEDVLAHMDAQRKQGNLLVPPALVADVTDSATMPSADQRYGLEQLLVEQHRQREEQYSAFREHWYQLRARDFHREILDMLDEQSKA